MNIEINKDNILGELDDSDFLKGVDDRGLYGEVLKELKKEDLLYELEERDNCKRFTPSDFNKLQNPQDREAFKRFLCDIFDLGYHTDTNELLNNLYTWI